MSAESSSASTKKKLFADESSFAQFQNNVRISDQNPSANGLPNFFVETILKKLPDEHGQNRHKNLMNSANLLEMTLSSEKTLVSAPLFRQFRTITDLLEDRTCSKNISLSQSREQVGLSQAFQCDATMQASLYANEELLHLSKVHMRAYNQWQQLLFSSICRTGFMANPRFYEYSRIAPSFLSDCFSSDFSYIRHFEHQNNSIVNIDKSAGIDSQAQSLPPVTASCSELNEHRKQQKSLSETENILFQLNELSEKIPVYCQTPNDQKTTEVLPSKERKLYRNSPSRLGLKLNTETSRASSSSVSNIFTATSSADSNEHPAWVFCTRYSDRPCAGWQSYIFKMVESTKGIRTKTETGQ